MAKTRGLGEEPLKETGGGGVSRKVVRSRRKAPITTLKGRDHFSR